MLKIVIAKHTEDNEVLEIVIAKHTEDSKDCQDCIEANTLISTLIVVEEIYY